MQLIAKTLAGLEGVLAAELEALGAQHIRQTPRAVHFEGDQWLMYRANLELRTALRILRPLASFPAKDADALYKAVYQIDWPHYLDVQGSFAVDAVVWSEVWRHAHFAALKTKDAIADRFRKALGRRPSVDTDNPDLRVHLHINGLKATLSLDSSGDSLHRRGYRAHGGTAPLNEVLAAGMILLTGWQADRPLLDPMCGSGTLLIEAALLAGRIPPQWLRKHFGFQRWKDYKPAIWERVRKQALAQAPVQWPPILGYDKDLNALRIAQANIEAAHLQNRISLEKLAFDQLSPPEGPGILITNPPYNERMPLEEAFAFYKQIGDILKQRFAGYDAWIISAHREALKRLGLRPSQKIALFNGPLECGFHKFSLYEGSKKPR